VYRSVSFAARVLVVLALTGLALALWQLRHLVLLVFGGVLLAVILAALARRIDAVAHVGQKAAVAACVLVLLVLLGAGGWLVGDALLSQAGELATRLPEALEAVRAWVQAQPFGSALVPLWDQASDVELSWRRVAGAAGVTLGFVGSTVLVVMVGIFVAAEPALYRRGILALLPPAQRGPVGAALGRCGEAVQGWLKGQAVAMLLVGVATGGGLALLDVRLALVLGVLAGVLDFVPFFGPIVSGALAVLLALSEGPDTALYVAALVLVIQQVEGNVLVPLLQRRAVHLPPAVAVLAVVVAGVLFGIAGVVFATPLAVVTMVLVQHLYVARLSALWESSRVP
jgi:predicted PurR-regulated permease PerM